MLEVKTSMISMRIESKMEEERSHASKSSEIKRISGEIKDSRSKNEVQPKNEVQHVRLATMYLSMADQKNNWF